MDINAIQAFIGNIGFPIIACYFMYKMLQEQTRAHKEEAGTMAAAVADMTAAINKLSESLKLGGFTNEQ